MPQRSSERFATPPSSGGQVTALKRQRRLGRVNVYLDDEFWVGLSEELLIKLGIYQGQELSAVEAQTIEEEVGRGRFWDAALRFLSYRPRSEAEVRRKLTGLGAGEEETEQTLTRLRELSLVDDRAFAEGYLRDRDQVRPIGGDRLRQELRRYGVEREIVDEVLHGREDAELEQLRALARRDALWASRADRASRAKLWARLRRRGFSSSQISAVLRED